MILVIFLMRKMSFFCIDQYNPNMKILQWWAVIIIIFIIAACKKNDVEPVTLDAPFSFVSLIADHDTVENGNKTRITANASGSNLTYHWDGPVGIISGSGHQVTFFACCPGDHWITCTVNDSRGYTDSKIINIHALE